MSERGDLYDIAKLLQVMAALRDPTSGCPWDIEQTFETIAPYTIEEAYEVADAIERHDMADLREELGDLLLQVVYHAQMAAEDQRFNFADVVDGISCKMIRRHPHVFGTDEERAKGPPDGFWERIKAEERLEKERERRATGQSRNANSQGLLNDIPVNLPALTRAVKLQNKTAKVGFDWPDLKSVFEKMREELAELEEAIETSENGRIIDEFGDLLFVMANVARHLQIDPEASLSRTNAKFVRRFTRVEQLLDQMGSSPAQATLQEMDALWDRTKDEERTGET